MDGEKGHPNVKGCFDEGGVGGVNAVWQSAVMATLVWCNVNA